MDEFPEIPLAPLCQKGFMELIEVVANLGENIISKDT
jgi:hypothetical protein